MYVCYPVEDGFGLDGVNKLIKSLRQWAVSVVTLSDTHAHSMAFPWCIHMSTNNRPFTSWDDSYVLSLAYQFDTIISLQELFTLPKSISLTVCMIIIDLCCILVRMSRKGVFHLLLALEKRTGSNLVATSWHMIDHRCQVNCESFCLSARIRTLLICAYYITPVVTFPQFGDHNPPDSRNIHSTYPEPNNTCCGCKFQLALFLSLTPMIVGYWVCGGRDKWNLNE